MFEEKTVEPEYNLPVGTRVKYVARFHCPAGAGSVNFQGMKIVSVSVKVPETCGMKITWFTSTKIEIERTWAAGRTGQSADHCAFHLVVEVTERPNAATIGMVGGASTVNLLRED